MSGLFRSLHADPLVELKLFVSGAHLSPSFGSTVTYIEDDGFDILAKLETLIDSNSLVGRLKTASLLLQGSIDAVANFAPDMILFAGDREDCLVGAMLGAYLAIPTVHFFGGDHAADGHVDNPVRHATSKLSTVHLAATEEHGERLRSLGEPDERIHVVGSVALDRFHNFNKLSLSDLREHFDLKHGFQKFALVIHHPITEEMNSAGGDLGRILDVLALEGIDAFVGYPNTDPGNKELIRVIEERSQQEGFCFYRSLSRDLFMSLYTRAEFLIGNSSSGISEAAMVPMGVVNVGQRQRGRSADRNVIFCDGATESIHDAICRVRSASFRRSLEGMSSHYGDGNSIPRVHRLLMNLDLESLRFKREDPLAFSGMSLI